jgi:hypothetical protein
MKVAEKDIVVQGMLEDEYARCRETVTSGSVGAWG